MKDLLPRLSSLLAITIVTVNVCADRTLQANNEILLQIDSRDRSREKLITYASEIFCRSHLKVVHVYYENETSLSYPGKMLKLVNQCGLAHVVFRNKFRRSALEVLKDDGIQMHLVMVLRDISQSVQLEIIRKKSAAKHLTFILLLIEDSSTVTKAWLRRTFQNFWRMWISQVVIMYCQKDIIFIYCYDPFAQELVRKSFLNHHNVHLNELFPRRLYDMRMKAFRICLYDDGIRLQIDPRNRYMSRQGLLGADGLMAEYMAESFHAKPFVDPVNPYVNVSTNRDLCFKEIVDEVDDFAGNIRFLALANFYKRVEHTIVLSRDDLCVMVPKAGMVSPLWNLFRSFDPFVWILIATSLIVAYLFCLNVYRHIFNGTNLLLDLLSCIISTPIVRHSQPTVSLRIFIFFWLIYGLLISAAFKAKLTGRLVEREYLPDMETLKDLAESPYPLATRPRHVKHLQRYLNPRNPYESMIKNKIVQFPDSHFKDLIDSNNLSYAYLQKYHVSVYQANLRKHHRNAKPLYHVMSQCLVPFHAVYIVPYGSPYLGGINKLIRNAQEFGLTAYWNSQMKAAFRRTKRSAVMHGQNNDAPVVLKLIHYHIAFFLLICGLLVALIYFFIENLYVHIVI